MAEAVVDQPVTGSETVTPGNQQTQAPGWLAGLPAELRDNETFKPYKTVGDFAKAHIETATKAKELETKLGNTIPKLGENATQEERAQFFNSLGRPEKPEGYELEGGDQEKERVLAPWKQEFHELGLTAAQAKGLKAKWDGRINGLIEQHQAKAKQEIAEASTKLKTEWGDKYDANLELVNRFWKKETDSEFDKAFDGESSANRFTMMRFLFKVAAKTGEDTSQAGSQHRQAAAATGNPYPKSVMPPKRT
jgi:hypothetical protein